MRGGVLRRVWAAGRRGAVGLVLVCAMALPRPVAAEKVAQPGSIANPSVGMGLAAVNDWSTQLPFLDLMKTSRHWIGFLPGQWGGWDQAQLEACGCFDADGWPTSIPGELASITTLILTDIPAAATATAGRYRLTFDGSGTVEVAGRATNQRYGKGEVRFDFVPGEGPVLVSVTRSDPRRTGDPVRNIRVVREDYAALLDAGAIFNPDWLALVADMRLVRFMDWMATNDSTQSAWADRPEPGDHTYTTKGVPLEVMLALANEIGADPWFTLPHLADDDYMRRFAEMVRDGLAPGLRAHVEYSNEVWNFQFQQAHWAEAEGQARWGQQWSWVQFYALRAVGMARIFDEVFGEAAPTRLVKVISSQTGYRGLEDQVLTAPLWVAENPGENPLPATQFDAYAVTGYFSAQLGNDDKVATVRNWIGESRAAAVAQAAAQGLTGDSAGAWAEARQYDAAIDLALAELRDGAVTGQTEDTVAELLGLVLPYHAEVAGRHGLDLIMYEGGTHVVGIGLQVDDPDLAAFFIALNYSQGMGALYAELMAGWRALGGTVFTVFVDMAAPSKWGSWGSLRYPGDATARWDAITAFNRDTPGWWDERGLAHPSPFVPDR